MNGTRDARPRPVRDGFQWRLGQARSVDHRHENQSGAGPRGEHAPLGRQQGLDWHRAQLVGLGEPELGEQLGRVLFGLGHRAARRRAALRDRLAEESVGAGHGDQIGDRHPPGRLPEDRDIAGVTAEDRDVVSDPSERGHLVEEAPVALGSPGPFVGKGRMAKEPEDAEPVVHGDDHHVAAAGQLRPLVEGRRARPAGERPTVDPDHDRLGRPVERGRPHVEGQAVLVLGGRGVTAERGGLPGLGRPRSVLARTPDAGPRGVRPRPAEAQGADRRRRERHAPKDVQPVLVDTLEKPRRRFGPRHGPLPRSSPRATLRRARERLHGRSVAVVQRDGLERSTVAATAASRSGAGTRTFRCGESTCRRRPPAPRHW
jgi:hypothetical protein